ncbi:MAG: hypothetical protein LBE22_12290 [Azoarcus sp.]|jgi:hypothetical protein|nr:hypothetical protein [Azoarcus sp.]
MNTKPTFFSRFILLIAIFSSLSLLSGCCGTSPCLTPWTYEGGVTTQEAIDAAHAKQAKEFAPSTGKLTVALQAVVEYPPLSQGLDNEQILQYIYTEKPELGQIFSKRKVSFTHDGRYVEVTVYADDKTTVLITDKSSTPEIDYIFKSD